MPESSRDVVQQLLTLGMSRRQIGLAIGRNDRLVGHVEKGTRPGANLLGTLADLRDRVVNAGRPIAGEAAAAHVPTAPRRTTKAGATARTRKKTTTAAGRRTLVKAGAVRSGAKSIAKQIEIAGRSNMRMALTLTFGPKAKLHKSDGTLIPSKGRQQALELGYGKEGYHASMFAQMVQDAGGNATEAIVQWAKDAGRLSSDHIPISIELRTWFER